MTVLGSATLRRGQCPTPAGAGALKYLAPVPAGSATWHTPAPMPPAHQTDAKTCGASAGAPEALAEPCRESQDEQAHWTVHHGATWQMLIGSMGMWGVAAGRWGSSAT